MLSYLTPPMNPQLSSSDSGLLICSTSSEEGEKSLYPPEDQSLGLFNSPHLSYSHPPKASMPFIYGHSSTPAYGFGFNFYDEMSPFAGKSSSLPGSFIEISIFFRI